MIDEARQLAGAGGEEVRLDLEPARMQRQAAGEGAICADMLAHQLHAYRHRRLEVGRGERRVRHLVGEIEPALGQAARGELVGQLALGRAQLDLVDHEAGEALEVARVGAADLGARLGVGDRQRAETRAVAGDERGAGEEAQAAALDRARGEAAVLGDVGDDDGVVGVKRELAEREVRPVRPVLPGTGREQPHAGERRAEDARGDVGDTLEAGLAAAMGGMRCRALFALGRGTRHGRTSNRAVNRAAAKPQCGCKLRPGHGASGSYPS